jgi:hypothetical protein
LDKFVLGGARVSHIGEKFQSLEQRIQAPGNGARVCSVLLEIDVDEQDYTP